MFIKKDTETNACGKMNRNPRLRLKEDACFWSLTTNYQTQAVPEPRLQTLNSTTNSLVSRCCCCIRLWRMTTPMFVPTLEYSNWLE